MNRPPPTWEVISVPVAVRVYVCGACGARAISTDLHDIKGARDYPPEDSRGANFVGFGPRPPGWETIWFSAGDVVACVDCVPALTKALSRWWMGRQQP